MKNSIIPLFLSLFFFFNTSYSQMGITSAEFDAHIMNESHSVFENVAVGNSYQVISIDVDVKMKDQIAEVSVTQKLLNSTDRDLEIEIFFPLPNGGIVQNFMMMVEGVEVPGELLEKDKAKSIYEGIVRRKRDPALMEYVGYGLFKTSVFPVPVGKERDITVRYTQVCDRKLDMINFSYPFGTQKFSSKPLHSVKFHARIQSSEEIKNIYSPTDDILVKRGSDNTADISYEKTYITPENDFKMTYSLQSGPVGATVLSYMPEEGKDGYFMLLASPSVAEDVINKTEKNIIFVLDRSGSMSGKKISQSKKALEFVLTNLNEGDNFNIVDYDDRVEMYKPEMQRYTAETYKEAINYVGGIRSGGGTNINDALVESLAMFQDDNRPNYLLFLTDGLASSGITNEMQIAKNVVDANLIGARIFAFGVGNDVNARLLDRLTSNNGGVTEYVKPHEDIEIAFADLYGNISSPVMTDINVSFSNTDVRSTYPDKLPDLFKGSQLVWVGKYNKTGNNTITVKGKVGGKEQNFVFKVDLASARDGDTFDYLEQIWASRRVGHLIDQIDLNGRSDELVNELVSLSKEFGILTPYTAFLAREDVVLSDNSAMREESVDELKALEQVSGIFANNLRSQKKDFVSNTKIASASEAMSYEDAEGELQTVNTIKQIGAKTFYLRNEKWVEGTLDDRELKVAIEIKKFSDGYFKVAKGQKAQFNKYLAFEEDIVVRIDDKVYKIVK
jgi:Ca-activated chloride channel homolog